MFRLRRRTLKVKRYTSFKLAILTALDSKHGSALELIFIAAMSVTRAYQHRNIWNNNYVVFQTCRLRVVEHVDLLHLERDRTVVVELDVFPFPCLSET